MSARLNATVARLSVLTSETFLPSVMSSEAQRSRDICLRTPETSDSQADPSTALGVTRGTMEVTRRTLGVTGSVHAREVAP